MYTNRFQLLLSTMLVVPVLFSLSVSSKAADTFGAAKRQLIGIYKKSNQRSFYCSCPIQWHNKKGVPQLKRCGYKIRKQATRANRIEWEHIVPASWVGWNLPCWRDAKRRGKLGREACKKASNQYNRAAGDLHNIVPAIGEINADRLHFRFNAGKPKPAQYGSCPMEVNFKRKYAVPPANKIGFIARAHLYMAEKHPLKLSDRSRKQYMAWNEASPPSQWECQRNAIITAIQGNDNHFITEQCSR